MTKINKAQLGKDLQEILTTEEIKVKAAQGEEFVEKFFAKITDYLVNGDTVDIYGFGKYEPKLRKARNGVNPQTKKPTVYPETKTATFKFAKRAKDAIKG